jgi:hypothetical protein
MTFEFIKIFKKSLLNIWKSPDKVVIFAAAKEVRRLSGGDCRSSLVWY